MERNKTPHLLKTIEISLTCHITHLLNNSLSSPLVELRTQYLKLINIHFISLPFPPMLFACSVKKLLTESSLEFLHYIGSYEDYGNKVLSLIYCRTY